MNDHVEPRDHPLTEQDSQSRQPVMRSWCMLDGVRRTKVVGRGGEVRG